MKFLCSYMLLDCKNCFKSRNLEYVLKWHDGRSQMFMEETVVLYLPSVLIAEH